MPPSEHHEGLLLPFQQRPQLAAELVNKVLGHDVVRPGSAEILDSNLTQIAPTEYRADLVVMHRYRRSRVGIIVEVQLHRDRRKKYTWPLYAAALRAKYECPTHVLVVTPHVDVATWAAKPVPTGLSSDVIFRPLVCGPSVIPCITDPDTAQRNPELAVLSAKAHGMGPHALDVGKAALAASPQVDVEYRLIYTRLVLAAVPAAVRVLLEELMQSQNWDWLPKSKVVDGFVEQGVAKGRAEALMVVLAARHVGLTPEQRERILACRDQQVLDDWLARATVATSADEVLF